MTRPNVAVDNLETIREATNLILERAAAATPGPWAVEDQASHGEHRATLEIERFREYRNHVSFGEDFATAEHVASWHPVVATLIADWLKTAGADLWAHGPLCCVDGCDECDDIAWAPHVRRALAFCRAYLGQDQ